MYDEKLKGQTNVFEFLEDLYMTNAKKCVFSEKDYCKIKQKYIRHNVKCPCDNYTQKEL